MRLQHCVITSVNRDELKDGGAEIWARTIRAIKARSPKTTIEVLLPDFKGDWAALDRVLEERPDVVSHNMETVKRLYRQVRPQAKYERSLDFIRHTKAAGLRTKSGAMLGLGEAHEEVLELMQDLLDHGCEVLTLGQYLQPTAQHLPVVRFLPPEEFETYRQIGLEMGFDYVESGPLVRSSYHSERHVKPRQQR
jgi:lipoic acid synthetase